VVARARGHAHDAPGGGTPPSSGGTPPAARGKSDGEAHA
jgi:hypothetical protein